MNLYNLLLGLLGSCFFLSCSSMGLKNAQNKNDYIETTSGLSYDSRKEQLAKDAEYLASLIKSSKNIRIYYSFSFGSGGSSRADIDTAQAFVLPLSDTIEAEFAQLSEVWATQQYARPNSDFTIDCYQAFNHINRSDIDYKIKNVYVKDNVIMPKDIGLDHADSLLATANYSFATVFDTLAIDHSTGDSILYKEYKIDIDAMDSSSLEIECPIGIKVIGKQALSTNGVLMNSNGYSSFPIFGLKLEVEEQIKDAISLINIAAQMEDKDACKAELEKIDSNIFTCKASIEGLMEAIDKVDKENKSTDEVIDMIKSYMKKYAAILGPRLQHLEIAFPQPFDKILLYIEKENKTISRELTVRCEDENDKRGYKTFLDNATGLYGVINNESEVVIDASFPSLIQVDSLYFEDRTDYEHPVTYYLRVQEKKMKKVPGDIYFSHRLGNGLAVFYDKDEYNGILLDNEKQILPYRFDQIRINGNVLIAGASKRGRMFYELYTLDGRKIDLPIIKDISTVDGNPNTIVYVSHYAGLVNKDGKVALPLEYDRIKLLNNNLVGFKRNEDDLWGIMDVQGKIVSQPAFYEIEAFSGNRAAAYNKEAHGGYIDETGNFVIAPRFSWVYSFYKGYALTTTGDDYELIDESGRPIKSFPEGVQVSFYDGEEGEDGFYETSDGAIYNYKGELVKQ